MLLWDSWEFLESWLHSECDNWRKIVVLHWISSQISQTRQMKNSLIVFILLWDAHQGIVTVPSVHHMTFHTGVQMMKSFQIPTQSWNHDFRGAEQACWHVISQKCQLYHEVLQRWRVVGQHMSLISMLFWCLSWWQQKSHGLIFLPACRKIRCLSDISQEKFWRSLF